MKLNINTIYQWELETSDGIILKQFDENRIEQSWKQVDADKVVRVSFIPQLEILPRHNIFIDHTKGEKFIRRFGRGFIRQKSTGFKLSEYVYCCVTNRYKFWVFPNGHTMITHPDYEFTI